MATGGGWGLMPDPGHICQLRSTEGGQGQHVGILLLEQGLGQLNFSRASPILPL